MGELTQHFSLDALLDKKLLDELQKNSNNLAIATFQDDLINFEQYANGKAELIVCMTDTLLHLESKEKVSFLLQKVFASLEDEGKFIITFRDLSSELSELDRFAINVLTFEFVTPSENLIHIRRIMYLIDFLPTLIAVAIESGRCPTHD